MSLPRRVYQELLLAVRRRDGAEAEKCPWCERRFDEIQPRLRRHAARVQKTVITFEHIVAKRDGGAWDVDNLVLACVWCNTRREQLAALGVQDEQRLIQELVAAEAQRQAERARRRELAFAATGAGWGRAQTALIEEAR